jgi:hypothetical protein
MGVVSGSIITLSLIHLSRKRHWEQGCKRKSELHDESNLQKLNIGGLKTQFLIERYRTNNGLIQTFLGTTGIPAP